MTKRVPFTKEFEREAVRLAETSARSPREVAEGLALGLSTITRWISRNRDAAIDGPELVASNEDMAAERKRLRRENEILRQEREIPKRATAFFAKEKRRRDLVSSIRRRKNSPHLVFAMSWALAKSYTYFELERSKT